MSIYLKRLIVIHECGIYTKRYLFGHAFSSAVMWAETEDAERKHEWRFCPYCAEVLPSTQQEALRKVS